MTARNNTYQQVFKFLKTNKKFGFKINQIQTETQLPKQTVYNAVSYLNSINRIRKERIYNTPETKQEAGTYYFV